jgi:hypothetical protein
LPVALLIIKALIPYCQGQGPKGPAQAQAQGPLPLRLAVLLANEKLAEFHPDFCTGQILFVLLIFMAFRMFQ